MIYYDQTIINKKKYKLLCQMGGNDPRGQITFDLLFNNPKQKQQLGEFIDNINKDQYLKQLIKNKDPMFVHFTFDNINTYKDYIFCSLVQTFLGNDNNTCSTKNVFDKNKDKDEEKDKFTNTLTNSQKDRFLDQYIGWVTKNYIQGTMGQIKDIDRARDLVEDYIKLKNNDSFQGPDAYLSQGLDQVPGIMNYKNPNDKQGLFYIIEKYKNTSHTNESLDEDALPGDPKNVQNYKINNQKDYELFAKLNDNVKNSIVKLTLGNDKFYQPLEPGFLPKNLQILVLGPQYDEPIPMGTLPQNLKELTFGPGYDQPIQQGVLPENLEKITFDLFYNQPLGPLVLPGNLKELIFGVNFNQPLERGVFPDNLEKITFGNEYNQRIDPGVLPRNLKELTFLQDFNQWIDQGVIPENLYRLTFGSKFNQPLDPGVLPGNLKLLEISNNYHFKSDLEKIIDKSIIKYMD